MTALPVTIPESFIAVCPMDEPSREKARYWSARLGVPLVMQPRNEKQTPVLVVANNRLEIHVGQPKQKGVFAEFSLAKAHAIQRQEGKNGLLPRAIGLRKHPHATVWDVTAGLGQDGFLLACYGCRVHWVERSPIVAALLEDALERGLADSDTRPILQGNVTLDNADAIDWLHAQRLPPEVIFLDPMFAKANASALSKKEMQVLRLLVGLDDDAPALLAAALRCHPQRVVVKRPLKAPPLDGRAPSFNLQGTTIRYDIYLAEQM
ncbi:MAG: class I SAM-dependent methyltransferase [Magnetococcales bacterium]|nr:class I SAM-dependent methyltransferase [Magnetococcales bacterium]